MKLIALRTRFRNRPHCSLAPAAIAMCVGLLTVMALYPEPITPLAFAILPIAGLACYYFPVQIVILAIAVTVFRIHEAYPSLRPTKLPLAFGALATATIFLHFVVLRTERPYWNRTLTYFAILLGCILLSAIFAESPTLSIDFVTILYWKIILLVVGLAWLLRRPEHFDFAARIFVLSGIALAGCAIYNWINSIALIEDGRVTIGPADAHSNIENWSDPTGMLSTLGDSNDLALYLILPLSFAVAMAVTRSSRMTNILGIAASAVILLAIIITQSCGGLLGVSVLFGTIIYTVSKSKVMILTAICVGGLALSAAISFSRHISSVTESAIERGLDESTQGRIDNWLTSVYMAVKRPQVGVGISNFMDSYYRFTDTPRRRDKAVHSIWFQVIGELGFVAFGILVAMFATLVKMSTTNLQILKSVSSVPPSLHVIGIASIGALAGFMVARSFLTQAFNWALNITFALLVATIHALQKYAPSDAQKLKQASNKSTTHSKSFVSHFTYSDPKSINTNSTIKQTVATRSRPNWPTSALPQ